MPTYVSLFSGCGGLDLGFAIAGYRCLGAYDVDTAAVDTYNHNFPSEHASVADLSGDYLNNLHRHADAVVAGPPCQGFSTIGRRDPTDARNCLLLKPVDFAIASKAKVLVVENVPGALSGTHSTYLDRSAHSPPQERLHCGHPPPSRDDGRSAPDPTTYCTRCLSAQFQSARRWRPESRAPSFGTANTSGRAQSRTEIPRPDLARGSHRESHPSRTKTLQRPKR